MAIYWVPVGSGQRLDEFKGLDVFHNTVLKPYYKDRELKSPKVHLQLEHLPIGCKWSHVELFKKLAFFS